MPVKTVAAVLDSMRRISKRTKLVYVTAKKFSKNKTEFIFYYDKNLECVSKCSECKSESDNCLGCSDLREAPP